MKFLCSSLLFFFILTLGSAPESFAETVEGKKLSLLYSNNVSGEYQTCG
jgi:hypothetical protein